KRPWGWWRYGVHGLPTLTIVLLLVLEREAIDLALIAIFVGYALAILRLMRPGTDALRLAPFEGAAPAYRASLFSALCLLLSAAVDLFVVLDLAWAQGAYVRPVIAIANLCLLVILAIAAASTGAPPERVPVMPSAPDVPAFEAPASEGPAPEAATAEEAGTMDAIERLMQTKRVYRDVDLNLDRLARKAGIPARQISAAINRATGKNVSQTPDRDNRYRAMIGRFFCLTAGSTRNGGQGSGAGAFLRPSDRPQDPHSPRQWVACCGSSSRRAGWATSPGLQRFCKHRKAEAFRRRTLTIAMQYVKRLPT
ncbi:hypothetical protein C8J36_105334, partial [Rhizobium sp. PP-F2F-G48]